MHGTDPPPPTTPQPECICETTGPAVAATSRYSTTATASTTPTTTATPSTTPGQSPMICLKIGHLSPRLDFSPLVALFSHLYASPA